MLESAPWTDPGLGWGMWLIIITDLLSVYLVHAGLQNGRALGSSIFLKNSAFWMLGMP